MNNDNVDDDKYLYRAVRSGNHFDVDCYIKTVKDIHLQFTEDVVRELIFRWNKDRVMSILKENQQIHIDPIIFFEACQLGMLEALKILVETRGLQMTSACLNVAAEFGHVDILQWYYNTNKDAIPCSENALDLAAKNGHLPVVRYLTEIGTKATTNALDWAVENGHMSIVIFLCNERKEGLTEKAIYSACEKGYDEILHFILRSMGPFDIPEFELSNNKSAAKHAILLALDKGHITCAQIIISSTFMYEETVVATYLLSLIDKLKFQQNRREIREIMEIVLEMMMFQDKIKK